MNIKWDFVIPLNDESKISEIESKFKIKISKELFDLIKKYNAGYPNKNICNIEKLGARDLKCLLSYNENDGENIYDSLNYFLEKYDGFVIPFAVDSGSGTYLYTTSGIYYVDANNSEMFFVAKNIENFLESLTEEWKDGWY